MQVRRGRDSTRLMIMALTVKRVRYRAKMVAAILTVWSLILLKKADASSL